MIFAALVIPPLICFVQAFLLLATAAWFGVFFWIGINLYIDFLTIRCPPAIAAIGFVFLLTLMSVGFVILLKL